MQALGDLPHRERHLPAQPPGGLDFVRIVLPARGEFRFLPAQAPSFLDHDALGPGWRRFQAQLAKVVSSHFAVERFKLLLGSRAEPENHPLPAVNRASRRAA